MSTALLKRITDPDARRRLQEALLAEPIPEAPMMRPPTADPISRYRFPRPWWDRLFGAGCAGCGGKAPGWLQRQIQTPKRTIRLALWFANLLPRAVGLWTALTGGLVDQNAYDERQARCDPCPDRVIHLRLLKGTIHEKSYCGACNCPKWWLAILDIKNRLRGWGCPKRRHVGSDPDAIFRVYILAKTAEAERPITDGSGGDGTAIKMTAGNPIRRV